MTVETTGALVYLHGDSVPVLTSLSVEQVLAKIYDLETLRETGDLLPCAFLRLAHHKWHDALVRPEAIVAITSAERDEDDVD